MGDSLSVSSNARQAERLLAEVHAAGVLERSAGEWLAARLGDAGVREPLLESAHQSRLEGKGRRVSVSRNIFIPLTNLCRDRCAYCTFARQPDDPAAHTYTLSEVEEAVRAGLGRGCTEALFCLGDKPEVAYRAYRELLVERGLRSTSELLLAACERAFELGIFPHTNAGILNVDEMLALRASNVSLGLMLESTSTRLREKGGAHYYSPDKDPAVRIRMHEEAGELRIPFTSGLLLGIGESDADRIDTLLTLRSLADRYGHIQEVIVQPFHPKADTPMRGVEALDTEHVAGWVALTRLAMGSDANIQAPPNLAPDALELLLRSGLNDWGGVSPLTLDFINPEAPWPELVELQRRSEAAGDQLVERLPIYPEFLQVDDFLEPAVREACRARVDASGYLPLPPSGRGRSNVEAA